MEVVITVAGNISMWNVLSNNILVVSIKAVPIIEL